MFLTAKSGALYIRNNPSTTVKEIVKRYPRLINQDGMIDQDFHVIFEDDCLADSLFMKWPKYATKIMEFAEKTVNWQQQLDISADLMTDEHIHNVALQVLPVLFPTGIQVEKQRKKMKRATQEEALTAFVQFEPMGTNLPTILETKKEYTQPHLLCLGDDRRNPQQTFVIVEENAIPCPSFIKGVDTCFKLTYVMDIHYQWQCSNTWDFLQKVVYELGKGVFGNGLILIVFARQKRKNVVDITLFFMAVVDFSVSCFHILKTISYKYGTNDFTCQLTIMTARAGIFASVFFTIALAAYRYRAIYHPFRRPVSPRVGSLVSVASIIVSVIINIPAFFIVDALPLRTGLLTCVIVDRSSWMEVAFSALSLLLFIAAVLVSIVLYTLLYRAIRKQQAVRRNLLAGRGRFKEARNQNKPTKPPTDDSTAGNQDGQSAPSELSTTMIKLDAIQVANPNDVVSAESNSNTVVMVADNEMHTTNANEDQTGKDGHFQEQDMENGDDPNATEQAKAVEPRLKMDPTSAQPEDKGHHVTRLLFIITVIFLLTWFPSIAYEYLPTNLTMSREHTLSSATLLLVQLKLSNHFINVFVYLAVNAKFRRQVRELFCCCKWS